MNLKDLSPQDREFCERQERSTIEGTNGVCRHINMKKSESRPDDEPEPKR